MYPQGFYNYIRYPYLLFPPLFSFFLHSFFLFCFASPALFCLSIFFLSLFFLFLYADLVLSLSETVLVSLFFFCDHHYFFVVCPLLVLRLSIVQHIQSPPLHPTAFLQSDRRFGRSSRCLAAPCRRLCHRLCPTCLYFCLWLHCRCRLHLLSLADFSIVVNGLVGRGSLLGCSIRSSYG